VLPNFLLDVHPKFSAGHPRPDHCPALLGRRSRLPSAQPGVVLVPSLALGRGLESGHASLSDAMEESLRHLTTPEGARACSREIQMAGPLSISTSGGRHVQ